MKDRVYAYLKTVPEGKVTIHSNGQKALYPTFVNRGNNDLLDNGENHLFTIKMKAKKAGKFNLKAIDSILVDRNLGTIAF